MLSLCRQVRDLSKFYRPLFFSIGFLLLPALVWAKPLNIGSISVLPADEIKHFASLLNHLIKELKSEGIDQGKVVVVKSIPEMADALKGGRVDLFIDSPFPAVAVSQLSGAKMLLRRWKKGQAEYHAVIFVRKDSGINKLEDLKGKMFAFEEPFSTATYFLPKLVLVEMGLKMVQKRSDSHPVAADEVGYIFVGDDPNSLFWVLKGKAAAGVANNQNFAHDAKRHFDSLKVIHETFSLPRQVVSFRESLDRKLTAKIKEALISMDQSEEGRKALQYFEKTTKFDELPDKSLLPLIRAKKFIDAEFGIR